MTTFLIAYSNSDKTCRDEGFLYSLITSDEYAYELDGGASDYHQSNVFPMK